MQHEFRFWSEFKICLCVAKPNAFETSGWPIGGHHHGDDQNKKEHGGLLGMRAVFVFGHHFELLEVKKALGFATCISSSATIGTCNRLFP